MRALKGGCVLFRPRRDPADPCNGLVTAPSQRHYRHKKVRGPSFGGWAQTAKLGTSNRSLDAARTLCRRRACPAPAGVARRVAIQPGGSFYSLLLVQILV